MDPSLQPEVLLMIYTCRHLADGAGLLMVGLFNGGKPLSCS